MSSTHYEVSGLSTVVPIDNYDGLMEPSDWSQYPEWIWYNDDGGYDD